MLTLYKMQTNVQLEAGDWGKGGEGQEGGIWFYTGTQENFGLTILIMVTILQVYTCQKMYQTAYFKYLVYCIAIDLQ